MTKRHIIKTPHFKSTGCNHRAERDCGEYRRCLTSQLKVKVPQNTLRGRLASQRKSLMR